jgi:hypothetical protein
MCFGYAIICFDFSQNICIDRIIYILLKHFEYIYFLLFLIFRVNKLKKNKWKHIHFILACREILKQWRIVNDSDFMVGNENQNYEHFYFDCKYYKTYRQEVRKITTNLYIRDRVFNLETLVFGYAIYDQAKYTCALLMKLSVLNFLKIFVSIVLFTSSLIILNISTFFCFLRDRVFNLETLVFGYAIYDQAYFDLNLLITLIFVSIYKAYPVSCKMSYF